MAVENATSEAEQAEPVEIAAEPAKLTLNDILAGVPPAEQEQVLADMDRKSTTMRRMRTSEQLANEVPDKEWEAEVTKTVMVAAQQLDGEQFPGTRVSSVTCGSTLCKIEVDQESEAEHQAFAGALHTGLRTFGVRRGGPDDDPSEQRGWTLFVARQGHKMPQVDLEELL